MQEQQKLLKKDHIPSNFFKGHYPQILLGPSLNTLPHIFLFTKLKDENHSHETIKRILKIIQPTISRFKAKFLENVAIISNKILSHFLFTESKLAGVITGRL